MRTGTIVAVGLLVVLVSIAGIGLVIGSDSGDQGQGDQSELTEEPTESATPDATATEGSPKTATQPTATPPEQQGVGVNQSQLVTAIESELNEGRSFNNQYQTDGTTAAQLSSMAENHSQDMADQQFLSHNVGNGNSQDRYQRNGLFDQCQFQEENYIVDASNNQLEVIGRVDAESYTGSGPGSLEERLAEALVSDWESNERYSERISYENAETIGVGVEVSNDDEVYATVNVC